MRVTGEAETFLHRNRQNWTRGLSGIEPTICCASVDACEDRLDGGDRDPGGFGKPEADPERRPGPGEQR